MTARKRNITLLLIVLGVEAAIGLVFAQNVLSGRKTEPDFVSATVAETIPLLGDNFSDIPFDLELRDPARVSKLAAFFPGVGHKKYSLAI